MSRKSRKNRSMKVGANVVLDGNELAEAEKRWEDWHWGVKPKAVVDWGDSDMPRTLIECGRLVRLQVRAPNGRRHPRRERDAKIQFSREISENSHIAFDPDHPYERLYLLVSPQGRSVLKQRFWDQNSSSPTRSLNQLAAIAGGKHGKWNDYPDVQAKVIGVLTAVVYYTHKSGDENENDLSSFYIHQVGEVDGSMPFLGCDNRGRLWIIGGSTRAPDPGITN